MKTKWSEEAWSASLNIYEGIKRLPFIKELSDGTLPNEKFRFYISQDNLYINDYCRVLAHIATRLDNMEDTETFLNFAMDGVSVEKQLHASFNPDTSLGKTPACLFYTSLLKAQANENVAIEVAAVLPCFWIYQKVGEYLLGTAKIEGNPYRSWIETYGDPAFDVSTKKAIDVCDRLAENADENIRRQMTEIYLNCSRMEWYFWDSAYKMEWWNI